MATAIYIKSESGDDYLYCSEKTLTQEDAEFWAGEQCPEDSEYWADFNVVHSDEGVALAG